MAKVYFEKDGRIGRIMLNRPDVLNAIDDDVPYCLRIASLAQMLIQKFTLSYYHGLETLFAQAMTCNIMRRPPDRTA